MEYEEVNLDGKKIKVAVNVNEEMNPDYNYELEDTIDLKNLIGEDNNE